MAGKCGRKPDASSLWSCVTSCKLRMALRLRPRARSRRDSRRVHFRRDVSGNRAAGLCSVSRIHKLRGRDPQRRFSGRGRGYTRLHRRCDRGAVLRRRTTRNCPRGRGKTGRAPASHAPRASRICRAARDCARVIMVRIPCLLPPDFEQFPRIPATSETTPFSDPAASLKWPAAREFPAQPPGTTPSLPRCGDVERRLPGAVEGPGIDRSRQGLLGKPASHGSAPTPGGSPTTRNARRRHERRGIFLQLLALEPPSRDILRAKDRGSIVADPCRCGSGARRVRLAPPQENEGHTYVRR